MVWRGRKDSDLRNVREHVHTDYKSGALSRSATAPLDFIASASNAIRDTTRCVQVNSASTLNGRMLLCGDLVP